MEDGAGIMGVIAAGLICWLLIVIVLELQEINKKMKEPE